MGVIIYYSSYEGAPMSSVYRRFRKIADAGLDEPQQYTLLYMYICAVQKSYKTVTD